MATMTSEGKFGTISTGIKHPILKHQFKVVFEARDLNQFKLDSMGIDFSCISLQVISIDPNEDIVDNSGHLVYEEDQQLSASRLIKRIKDEKIAINISILILDREEKVLSTIKFNDCKVLSTSFLQHFDYSSLSKRGAKIRIPPVQDSDLKIDAILNRLNYYINQSEIIFYDEKPSPSIKKELTFTYDSREELFS